MEKEHNERFLRVARPSLIDPQYCPKKESRWTSYGIYRMMLFAWLINDYSIVQASAELSHEGLYIMAPLYIATAILVGTPILFTEICLSQYSKCDSITVWDLCPMLRGVGYGTLFTTFLKIIHGVVLTTWYLEYTVYAIMNPPPWSSCDDYNTTLCLVKKVNKTAFQHCLEMMKLYGEDCKMKTASNFLFSDVIGTSNTLYMWPSCVYRWKIVLGNGALITFVFLISLRREKNIIILMRCSLIYAAFAITCLFCMSLSTESSWQNKIPAINWQEIRVTTCFNVIRHAILSMGSGFGLTLDLTRDVSFRSPANMTAVIASLLSMSTAVIMAFIAFNSICAATFYHGENEYILEETEHFYFEVFSSMAEVISYIGNSAVWSFLWFSSICVCSINIEMLLFMSLQYSIITYLPCARDHQHTASFLLAITIFIVSLLCSCSDITIGISYAIEFCQLVSIIMFTIGVYWIYGFIKHRNDILFMIGVKASYFWNISWVLSPFALFVVLYFLIQESLLPPPKEISYLIESIGMRCNIVLYYTLICFYMSLLVIGALFEISHNAKSYNMKSLFHPNENWGPADEILKKSRQMFVPEVMTREFLYRQVRIRGLCQARRNTDLQTVNSRKTSSQSELQLQIEHQEFDA